MLLIGWCFKSGGYFKYRAYGIYIYSTLTLTCKYASKQLYYLSKRGQIKDGSLVPALVHFGLDGLGNPWRVGPLGILLAQQTFIRT